MNINSESLPDLDIGFQPGFLSQRQADEIYASLLLEIPWEQHYVHMFGKQIAAPRRSSWHGAPDARYRYSGVSYAPKGYTPALLTLIQSLHSQGHEFNSVLCNHYRNAHDSMGWHSDDEPELGSNPKIASLSFGSTRRFCFRHKKLPHKFELPLSHGSLLLMQGATQHAWQHALPKSGKRANLPGADMFAGEAAPDAGRINLTFRWVYF